MKKLKIIKLFCVFVLIAFVIKFIKELYQVFYYSFFGGNKMKVFGITFPENWSEEVYFFLVISSLFLLGFLIFLTLEFKKVISNFSKVKVFTKSNSLRLEKIGKHLVIYGIIILLFDLILGFAIKQSINGTSSFDPAFNLGYAFGYTFGVIIAKRLPLFLVAFFIQFISVIVVKGNKLQQENDLTI